jgi:hypothetical protein
MAQAIRNSQFAISYSSPPEGSTRLPGHAGYHASYLVGYASQGTEWRYSGFVFGVEDGNSYLAKMLSGSAGAWLFRTPYTAEEQRGVLAFLPYFLLGKLAGPPGLQVQLAVLFHLFRLAAGILAILATYDFLAYFWTGRAFACLARPWRPWEAAWDGSWCSSARVPGWAPAPGIPRPTVRIPEPVWDPAPGAGASGSAVGLLNICVTGRPVARALETGASGCSPPRPAALRAVFGRIAVHLSATFLWINRRKVTGDQRLAIGTGDQGSAAARTKFASDQW